MATSTPNLVKISDIAAELWRFSFFQNGSRPPSWILLQIKNGVTAGCRLTMSTNTPNLVTISQIPAELLWCSVFQHGGRPPSWIWPKWLIGPTWWCLGSLKCPVKFHVDLSYCSEDIENSIFLTSGLKSPNHAHFLEVLWGSDTWTIFFLIETPKRHIIGWSRIIWGIDRENPSTCFCCRRRQEKREGKERESITQFRVIFQLYGERITLDQFLRKLAGLKGPMT